MSAPTEYVFQSEKRGAHFFLAADGQSFDRKGVMVRVGDRVTLPERLAKQVRAAFGERSLLDASKVQVADPDAPKALAAAQAEARLWELRARALAAPPVQRAAAAVAVGASKGASPAAQRAALVGEVGDPVKAAEALSSLRFDVDEADGDVRALREQIASMRQGLADATPGLLMLADIARAALAHPARRKAAATTLGMPDDGDDKAHLAAILDERVEPTAEQVAALRDIVAGWGEG